MPSKASFVYCILGNAYCSKGDFIKAIECYTLDLAIAKEVGEGGRGVREPWARVSVAGGLCEGYRVPRQASGN